MLGAYILQSSLKRKWKARRCLRPAKDFLCRPSASTLETVIPSKTSLSSFMTTCWRCQKSSGHSTSKNAWTAFGTGISSSHHMAACATFSNCCWLCHVVRQQLKEDSRKTRISCLGMGRYIFKIFGSISNIWPTVRYIHDTFHNHATCHKNFMNYFKCSNLYS